LDKEAFNLLPDLNQPKQLQSLEIMELGGAVYNRLNLMKMLTELDLVGHHDGMETAYFKNLMNMLRENFESLKITHLRLKCCHINAKNGTPLVFPQIKKWSLMVCVYHPLLVPLSQGLFHSYTL
jgi:hypothetical protein